MQNLSRAVVALDCTGVPNKGLGECVGKCEFQDQLNKTQVEKYWKFSFSDSSIQWLEIITIAQFENDDFAL